MEDTFILSGYIFHNIRWLTCANFLSAIQKTEQARDYNCDMECYFACVEERGIPGVKRNKDWGPCDEKCCWLA